MERVETALLLRAKQVGVRRSNLRDVELHVAVRWRGRARTRRAGDGGCASVRRVLVLDHEAHTTAVQLRAVVRLVMAI